MSKISIMITRFSEVSKHYQIFEEVMHKVSETYSKSMSLSYLLRHQEYFEKAINLMKDFNVIRTSYPDDALHQIDIAFHRLSEAITNREEFYQELKQVKDALDYHMKTLQADLEKTKKALAEEYEKFVEQKLNDGKISNLSKSILLSSDIQKVITDFLLD